MIAEMESAAAGLEGMKPVFSYQREEYESAVIIVAWSLVSPTRKSGVNDGFFTILARKLDKGNSSTRFSSG